MDALDILDQLTWRHYIVYWSSVYAIHNTKSAEKIFVECGVCDGLSTYYALTAAVNNNKYYRAYLYDSWGAMRGADLLESEKKSAGSYAYLSMDNTKNNLKIFENDAIVFNRGYIPEVFQVAQNPDSLVWLHIDLNSATPTAHALAYFWDKLESGGLILFDDYAHPGYQDTQEVVEKWSADRNGMLFHLPTGQALFIKI